MADEKDVKDPNPNPPADSGAAGPSTAAATKEAPKRSRPKQLPPYKVLLHNDDVNDMEHVILSILKVTNLSAEDATMRMLEAHHRGVALLLVTHKERAELYVEQFRTFSLSVTIEPDA